MIHEPRHKAQIGGDAGNGHKDAGFGFVFWGQRNDPWSQRVNDSATPAQYPLFLVSLSVSGTDKEESLKVWLLTGCESGTLEGRTKHVPNAYKTFISRGT